MAQSRQSTAPAQASRLRDVVAAPAPAAEPAPAAGQAPKRVTILGATGSIGSSTLDLLARAPGSFQVAALTAQTNVAKLADAARAHRAELAVIGDPSLYAELKERLAGTGIAAAAGAEALREAAALPADCVMAAIMGAAGLAPTFEAVRQGRRVALANKECLVSAGAVFMDWVARHGAELVPVDSEHSAALQALAGAAPESIEQITLTASGGPFRTWDAARLATVRPADALKHPNWSMGRKITVDSATMMNKGLELIEAYHLFPVEARPARRRGPPAVDRALPRRLHRRLRARPARLPRHAHADRAQPGLARAHARAHRAPGPRQARRPDLRGPRPRPLPLPRPGPGGARARGRSAGGPERRQRDRR